MALPLFVLLVPCLGLFAMLMPLFQPSCMCCLRSPTLRSLPWVSNGLPVRDTPTVDLVGSTVYIDGVKAGSTTGIVELDTPSVIPGLVNLLQRKAELYGAFHHGPAPSHCTLLVATDTPVVVVKSMVASAAQAGYTEVDFMSRDWHL